VCNLGTRIQYIARTGLPRRQYLAVHVFGFSISTSSVKLPAIPNFSVEVKSRPPAELLVESKRLLKRAQRILADGLCDASISSICGRTSERKALVKCSVRTPAASLGILNRLLKTLCFSRYSCTEKSLGNAFFRKRSSY